MICKNSPWVYDDSMIQIADQFSQHRRVAFADTDASGRVHFTAILRYVEDAEHAYLAEKGIELPFENIDLMKGGQFSDEFRAVDGRLDVFGAFDIDAELIVYGKTDPAAHCTLQNEPVKLRPDGTFTMRFSLPDSPMMAVAGLWRATAEWGAAFAMVMTGANEQAAAVHHRMPLILDPADYGVWLSCPVTEAPRFFRQWQGHLVAAPSPLPPRAPRAARGLLASGVLRAVRRRAQSVLLTVILRATTPARS